MERVISGCKTTGTPESRVNYPRRGPTREHQGPIAAHLDHQLHLGHRRRRAPRTLRPRQVPRRDPAHDRPPPPRRGARAHRARCWATPALSHARWQTVVASIGRRHGYAVHVLAPDRPLLDPRLARGAGVLEAYDVLPEAATSIDSLRFADIVYTRPGDRWPAVVCEVEHGGDVTAALRRCAETLKALRAPGSPIRARPGAARRAVPDGVPQPRRTAAVRPAGRRGSRARRRAARLRRHERRHLPGEPPAERRERRAVGARRTARRPTAARAGRLARAEMWRGGAPKGWARAGGAPKAHRSLTRGPVPTRAYASGLSAARRAALAPLPPPSASRGRPAAAARGRSDVVAPAARAGAAAPLGSAGTRTVPPIPRTRSHL